MVGQAVDRVLLHRAIRAVGAGQSLLDPAVTKGVFDRLRRGKHLLRDEKLARLSPRRSGSSPGRRGRRHHGDPPNG